MKSSSIKKMNKRVSKRILSIPEQIQDAEYQVWYATNV